MAPEHDPASPAAGAPHDGTPGTSGTATPMGSDQSANPIRIGNTLAMVSIVYSAILMGAVLFHVVAFILHEFDAMEPVLAEPWMPMAVVLAMMSASLLVGARTYTKQVTAAAARATDVERLRAWSVANIVRLAILEVPMLLNAVAMLLTGSLWFGVIFLVQLSLLFGMVRPTESRLRTELPLHP